MKLIRTKFNWNVENLWKESGTTQTPSAKKLNQNEEIMKTRIKKIIPVSFNAYLATLKFIFCFFLIKVKLILCAKIKVKKWIYNSMKSILNFLFRISDRLPEASNKNLPIQDVFICLIYIKTTSIVGWLADTFQLDYFIIHGGITRVRRIIQILKKI